MSTIKRSAAVIVNARPKVRLSDSARSGRVRATYDAAQTNTENTNHWAPADALSAAASASPAVRRVLRKRSRYEIANCPLARSILRKLADYVVGTGPRLQVRTKDREFNRAVEREFNRWAIAVKLSRKLWQMRYAKAMNGESFALFVTNLALATPVKLDLRTIEADQVADPTYNPTSASDGIIYDDYGNMMAVRVLKSHPGDAFAFSAMPTEFDTFQAELVMHFYDAERPGQLRGVPELTSALPLFAMRRRYILAVIAAAETAADHAAVIETQQSPEDPDDLVPLDSVEIERRMMLTMPRGWKLSQLKAEQPTTTIEMFDGVIIRETGRCVNMPFGLAASDSSRYNFASGKIDQSPWLKTIRIEQDALEDVVARPTFERWFAEAIRIPGLLPPSPMNGREIPPYQFFWDGQELLDPREAGAKLTALSGGFETHGSIYAKRGDDVLEQWEAEAELLGITLDEFRELVVANVFKTPTEARAELAREAADDDEPAETETDE